MVERGTSDTTGSDSPEESHPGGMPASEGATPLPLVRIDISIQVLRIVINALFEKFDELLSKGLLAMIFLVIRDVGLHSVTGRRAHGERSVSLLPGKLCQPDFVMHP